MTSHLLSLDSEVLIVPGSEALSDSSFLLLKSSITVFAYVELNSSRAVNVELVTSETL